MYRIVHKISNVKYSTDSAVVLEYFINATSHLYSSACQNKTKDNYKDKNPHHKYKDFN